MKGVYRLWRHAAVRWGTLALGIGMIVYGIILIAGSPVHMLASRHEATLTLTARPVGEIGLTTGQVAIMERMYRDQYDIDIAKTLLDQYTAKGNYQQAYDVLSHIQEKGQLSQLDQSLVARIVYNTLFDTTQSSSEALLAGIGHEMTTRILAALAKKDYTAYTRLMQESTDSTEPLVVALRQADQTYTTLTAAPPYYHTGLLAATLMQAGYVPYAQSIAADLLRVDPNYILAYEILSQAAMKQQHYADALTYLQKLFSLDKQHIQRTAFFLGLSYYFLNDYNQSLLYLQQVSDSVYYYDAQRYMILAYYHQGIYDQMMDGFRVLLHDKKTVATDYILLYDIMLYEPYRRGAQQQALSVASGDDSAARGSTFSLLQQYAISVLIPYIDACKKTIAPTSPYVCKYGEAGRYLSQGKTDKALKDLMYVSKLYPNPIIFQALGDYYTKQGSTQKAELFYAKAMTSSERPLGDK